MKKLCWKNRDYWKSFTRE